MTIDAVSGGPITRALIRGRSFRVRWLGNKEAGASKLDTRLLTTGLDAACLGYCREGSPLDLRMPIDDPSRYGVKKRKA